MSVLTSWRLNQFTIHPVGVGLGPMERNDSSDATTEVTNRMLQFEETEKKAGGKGVRREWPDNCQCISGGVSTLR